MFPAAKTKRRLRKTIYQALEQVFFFKGSLSKPSKHGGLTVQAKKRVLLEEILIAPLIRFPLKDGSISVRSHSEEIDTALRLNRRGFEWPLSQNFALSNELPQHNLSLILCRKLE